MNSKQKFNIGDLVAYEHHTGPNRVWGIIIEFGEALARPSSPVNAKVRWSNGWTDWYNTASLIMIEKAKR